MAQRRVNVRVDGWDEVSSEPTAWIEVKSFTPPLVDVLYHRSAEGIAKITINRPELHNAFRPLTVQILIIRVEHLGVQGR